MMDTKKPVIIVGADVIAKKAYDAFVSNDVVVYGFLDDKKQGESIDDVSVLGKVDDKTFFNIINRNKTFRIYIFIYNFLN